MGASEVLKLLITADTQGAVTGLKKVGDETQRSLGKGQATIDKWGAGLSKAGVGMIGFGAVALAGLGAAAKASEEANKSTLKLQTAVANNPKLNAENAKSFEALAQSIQSKTAADGDDIVAGMAVLAQGKLQASQIRELAPLVVDLARAKGLDEVQAFTLASKAAAGNTGALKRAGIQVDETKAKTDAYGATVDALRGSVGGFANAEGKTFAGSLQRMKNNLGDLEEGVGKGAVDAFGTLVGAVNKVAGALEHLSPGAQGTIGKVATFGAVSLVAVGGLSTLAGTLIQARRNFGELGAGISTAAGKVGGLANVAKAVPIAAIFAGVAIGLERMDDAAHRAEFGKITSGLNSAAESGRRSAEQMIQNSVALGTLKRDFRGVLDQSVPAAESFLDMARKLGVSKDTLAEFSKAISRKQQEDIGGAAAQKSYNDQVQQGADAMGGAADSADRLTAAYQGQLDQLDAMMNPQFALIDSLQANAEATAKVDQATRDYLVAVDKHGPASMEAKDAEQQLTAARLESGKSALNVTEATNRLNSAVAQNPKLLAESKAQLQIWVQQGLISKATAADLGAQLDTTAWKAVALGKTDPVVDLRTTGFSAATTAIQTVALALAGIVTHKTVSLDLHVTGLAAVQRAEAKLLGPGHAAGGPVKAGVAYPVGERGPELFMPDVSGTIIPHRSLTQMGGNVTYAPTINCTVVANDPQTLVEGLKRYMRNNGPLPLAVTGRTG